MKIDLKKGTPLACVWFVSGIKLLGIIGGFTSYVMGLTEDQPGRDGYVILKRAKEVVLFNPSRRYTVHVPETNVAAYVTIDEFKEHNANKRFMMGL